MSVLLGRSVHSKVKIWISFMLSAILIIQQVNRRKTIHHLIPSMGLAYYANWHRSSESRRIGRSCSGRRTGHDGGYLCLWNTASTV
ncbi:hypothetical protein BJX99DRAFT_2304 [Aspergillus californicus]